MIKGKFREKGEKQKSNFLEMRLLLDLHETHALRICSEDKFRILFEEIIPFKGKKNYLASRRWIAVLVDLTWRVAWLESLRIEKECWVKMGRKDISTIKPDFPRLVSLLGQLSQSVWHGPPWISDDVGLGRIGELWGVWEPQWDIEAKVRREWGGGVRRGDGVVMWWYKHDINMVN